MIAKPTKPMSDNEISELYQLGRHEAPSTDVDDKILAAAHRAVNSAPRRLSPFHGKWQVPVSIAATLVLAVVVVPGLFQHSEDIWMSPRTQISAPEPATSNDEARKVLYAEPKADNDIKLKQKIIKSPPAAMQSGASAESTILSRQRAQSSDLTEAVEEDRVLGAIEQSVESLKKESGATIIENWLEKIKALARAGELQQAKIAFDQFKQQYPNYPINDLETLVGP
jgi:soluble cytochrome b562